MDLTRLCLRLCSAGTIRNRGNHHLRGARLVVRVATVAMVTGRLLLATTSFLHGLGRPWGGCGRTLAPRSRASHRTSLHELDIWRHTLFSSVPFPFYHILLDAFGEFAQCDIVLQVAVDGFGFLKKRSDSIQVFWLWWLSEGSYSGLSLTPYRHGM